MGAISLCGPWRFALLIRECLSPHQSAATRRRAALHHGLLLAFDGMLIVAAVPLIVSIYRLDHLRRRLRQIASTYREEDARRWAEQAAPPPFTLLSVTPRLAIHGIGFKVIAKKDKGFGINRLWLDIEAGPSMPQKIPTLLTVHAKCTYLSESTSRVCFSQEASSGRLLKHACLQEHSRWLEASFFLIGSPQI